MSKLDKLDRKILYQLDINSRQSVSHIARAVRQGRDRIDYRIERMLDEGIIRKFTVTLNVYQLGFVIYKAYLRLENNKVLLAQLVEELRKHPQVFWVALCDGSWDLVFTVYAKSPKEFHQIYSNIISTYNEIVLNFAIYTLVDVYMYKKGYFLEKGGEFLLIGGEPKQVKIDTLDYDLLNLLSQNARISVTDLAEKLNTTQAIVNYRIQKLEDSKIISGYSIEVDLNKLNLLYFKTKLFLRDYRISLQDNFIAYCHANPHITQLIHQLGDCNIELEMAVRDYSHYNTIIEEIKETFSQLIRNYQTILIRKSHRYWVPRDLLSK